VVNLNFEEFLRQAWTDHATDPQLVAAHLLEGTKLITENSQINRLSTLATHIFGEHLGRWQDGVKFLDNLRQLSTFIADSECDQSITRSIKILQLAAGSSPALDHLSISEQIRICASTAGALWGQSQMKRASEFFKIAIEMAHTGLTNDDPANRVLAVTGNNLAASLESLATRSDTEKHLMLLAAHTGRKFWEIAGTWLEVERAEYRLAMSYLKAEDIENALKHAQFCLQLNKSNSAEPIEFFFAYEALALIEQTRNNSISFAEALGQMKKYLEMITDKVDYLWCEQSLNKLLE
jgi:hypothetical protein